MKLSASRTSSLQLTDGAGYIDSQTAVTLREASCEVTVPVRVGLKRPGDLPAFWADASHARNELQWQPVRDLDNMCSSTWQWQQAHPNGFNE